jgi:hypothetical protein
MMKAPAKRIRLTLNKNDVQNLITVLNWGLSDYDDEDHIKELEELLARIEKAEEKFWE